MQVESGFEMMAQGAKRAVDAIERDDAEALKALPDGAWWGAEVRLGGRESLGLASWAIKKDAGACLEIILCNPSWQAGHASSPADLEKVRENALEEGIERRSLECVVRLAMHPGQAWVAVEKCAPMRKVGEDSGYQRRIESARARGWLEGFERSLEIAVEKSRGRSLSEGEKEWASAALARAVGCQWQDKEALERSVLKATEACEALMSEGKPEMFILRVLQSAARQSVNGQVQAWGLALKAAERLGVDATVGVSSELGYAGESKHLSCTDAFGGARLDEKSQPMALFEKEIDVLWAAAVEVEDLGGVGRIRAMAKKAAGKQGPRPKCVPSRSGMTHPLGKLWEVWDHARQAGGALPKKPVEMAWEHFESSMKFWEKRMEKKRAEAVREQAWEVKQSLLSGVMSESFCGRMECPSVDEIELDIKGGLSPLAWVIGQKKTLKESHFIAVALAQGELGFSLDEALKQCRWVSGGVDIKGSWVAKAQSELLALAVEYAETSKKSGAGRL